jgi:hypothetical protein
LEDALLYISAAPTRGQLGAQTLRSFEGVSWYFAEAFSELVPGGRASLVMLKSEEAADGEAPWSTPVVNTLESRLRFVYVNSEGIFAATTWRWSEVDCCPWFHLCDSASGVWRLSFFSTRLTPTLSLRINVATATYQRSDKVDKPSPKSSRSVTTAGGCLQVQQGAGRGCCALYHDYFRLEFVFAGDIQPHVILRLLPLLSEWTA